MNNLKARLARIPELIERAEEMGDYREAQELCDEANHIEALLGGYDEEFNQAFGRE